MKHEPKGSFFGRVGQFIGERGFYLVLFLCVAVIGATAWVFSSAMSDTQPAEDVLSLQATPEPLQEEVPPTRKPVVTDPPVLVTPEVTAAPPVQPQEDEPVQETMAEVFDWPIRGQICAGYSVGELQYDPTMADWRTHSGLDIEAALGEKVCAAADGTVTRVYTDQMYGVTVVVDHGCGLCSSYANLAGTPTVAVGDSVTLGQVLGAVGETADAEIGQVSHLHFAMTMDGKRIDPNDYLR